MAIGTATSKPTGGNPKTNIPTTTKMVPKGKSGQGVKGSNQGKVTVPNNSANKKFGKPTLKTGKNNPKQIVKSSGSPRPMSSRINHNTLRRMK